MALEKRWKYWRTSKNRRWCDRKRVSERYWRGDYLKVPDGGSWGSWLARWSTKYTAKFRDGWSVLWPSGTGYDFSWSVLISGNPQRPFGVSAHPFTCEPPPAASSTFDCRIARSVPKCWIDTWRTWIAGYTTRGLRHLSLHELESVGMNTRSAYSRDHLQRKLNLN